jgi:molecular chaperone DnaK
VEARNRLDGLLYNTEKTLEENKDKVGPEDRAALETAIADAKRALEGEDSQAMDAARERLEQASHKLAEAMYRAQTAQGAGAGGDAQAGGAPSGGEQGDEVIDAEYVDVDEGKN